MNGYNKSSMIYKDYSWKTYAEGDPKITGKLDSTTFDKKEGHEVLYLIKKMTEIWKLEGRGSRRKIEKMIYKFLPSNLKKQEDIKNWVRDNWDYY